MYSILDFFSVKDKTVLITGAASGIGATCARCLHELGAVVFLAYIDKNLLDKASQNGSCTYLCDVTNEADIKGLKNKALETTGKIDILINSHGISKRISADHITVDEFDPVINVNLKGVFLTVSIIGKRMKAQKSGSIINISSTAAHVAMKNNVNYAASKGGVEAMSRSYAAEWAKDGVRVNCVAPGPCYTPFTETLYKQLGYKEELLKKIPRGEIAVPEDMIGTILLLASDAGRNITGQTIIVDGGYTIL